MIFFVLLKCTSLIKYLCLVTCPALSLPNGYIDYKNREMNGTYRIHTPAYFSCYGGYHLVGASQSTCEHNGWDQNTPRCDKNSNN